MQDFFAGGKACPDHCADPDNGNLEGRIKNAFHLHDLTVQFIGIFVKKKTAYSQEIVIFFFFLSISCGQADLCKNFRSFFQKNVDKLYLVCYHIYYLCKGVLFVLTKATLDLLGLMKVEIGL